MRFRASIFSIIVFFVALLCLDRLAAALLRYGVDINFGLDQEADMLIIGHSHITLATDKTRMEKELGLFISKYARPGVTVADRYIMAKQYLDRHTGSKLKHVLYGVDQFTFSDKGLSQNSYALFYPWLADKSVDSYISECAPLQEYWIHKLFHLTRYTDEVVYAAISGFRHEWINRKQEVMDISAYEKKLSRGEERRIHFEKKSYDTLLRTIKLFTDRGIRVTLLNLPTFYRLHGYEPEKYKDICELYQQIAADNELVDYCDLNGKVSEDHSYFRDPLHVNYRGQQAATDELLKMLKR